MLYKANEHILSNHIQSSTYYEAIVCHNHVSTFKPPRAGGIYYGGVYDSDYSFIKESSFTRYGLDMITPNPDKIVTKKLYGSYIYGGYLFNHYGHFILESLSRIWSYHKYQYPIIWTGIHPGIVKFSNLHIDTLKVLKIKDYILNTTNTWVENLIIPYPGLTIPDTLTNDYINSMGVISCKNNTITDRIWLSRVGLDNPQPQNIDYEYDLQISLEKLGWKIFYPHKYPIYTQLDTICKAKILAGFESSAFHTLLFFKNYLGKIKMFNRGRNIPRIHYLIKEKMPQLAFDIIDRPLDKNLILSTLANEK